MRIVQVNVEHGRGGAAVVMARLHHAFRERGHAAQMVVRLDATGTADPDVALIPTGGRLRFAFTRAWELACGLPSWAYPGARRLADELPGRAADVLHLHNLHGGYFNYRALPQIARRKPLIWTLHDMWALTGGCAHALACTRWQTGCGACPLLQPDRRDRFTPRPPWRDTTAVEWRHKQVAWRSADLTIVAPSRWLADLAAQSHPAHRPVRQIPNGVDLARFRPLPDRSARRARLGLAPDEPVLLFSAQSHANPLKGLAHLYAALRRLPLDCNPTLLTLGDSAAVPTDLATRFRILPLGYVWEESRLAELYACADLFVLPTLADNQPLVVLEALACGAPVVSFAVGGVPELVRPDETGYLARPGDAADFAHGILTLLRNPALRREMGARGRRLAVAEHDLNTQAERYLALYRELLERAASRAGGRP